ncbi:MFS general substrate transporter [Myriangium duriaei CBS 260.36]|uniref:MFS general substrate transporter n=1 Tax=Myriangium duriaei CBS 260.36 TaxID=1168546 RepID=A0A9P4JCG9_9PEZI|nr:MFS general substrate transporter [Myriangium duriaei CBS 260.36]
MADMELERSDNSQTMEHIDTDPFHVPSMPFTREVIMLIAVCSAQVMVQAVLAQGILPGTLIGRAFGIPDNEVSWGPAAYGMTSGALMLPSGRIGDIVGHRPLFIIAWAIFSISSIMAGLSFYSKSFIFYALCRGLQGVAAATLVPCALAILGSVYRDGPRKNLVFSLYAAGSPVGYTLGCVFSALIAQLSDWTWMFYLTGIVCALCAVLSYLSIPRVLQDMHDAEAKDDASRPEKQELDYAGALLGVGGLVLFCSAWNLAPSRGWSRPEVISTLVLGLILIVLFVLVERKVEQPLIPINDLCGEALLVLVIMAFGWASFGIMIYYLLNFTINLRKDSLLNTAAQQLPVPFAGLIASWLNTVSLAAGFLPADILAFSLVWFTTSCIILATMPVHQSYWIQTFWFYVIAPFGMDLSFPSATLLMSQLVPPRQQGIAASLIATVVYYSQSIGLGIAGTVESQVSNGNILRGYRGACYSSIILAGLGLVLGIGPILRSRVKRQRPESPISGKG